MGLSESALKPFGFLSHCKVSCGSPCCVKICGDDNHCNINIDTHEHIRKRKRRRHRKQIITVIIMIVFFFFFTSVVDHMIPPS